MKAMGNAPKLPQRDWAADSGRVAEFVRSPLDGFGTASPWCRGLLHHAHPALVSHRIHRMDQMELVAG